MNENLRRVTVKSTPLYRSDNGAGDFEFKMKRYYYGKDLSTLTPYLKIRFQDESTDKILLKNLTADEQNITVVFVVSDAFSRVAGDSKCQLCFENTDGSTVINSEPFTVKILDSVEVESYGQTVLPSAIRLLQTALLEKIIEMNAKIDKLNDCFITVNSVIGAENFVNGSQSIAISGAKEDSVITFSPIDNADVFASCGLYISGQGEDYVTVKYTVAPTADFTVRFLVVNKLPAVDTTTDTSTETSTETTATETATA